MYRSREIIFSLAFLLLADSSEARLDECGAKSTPVGWVRQSFNARPTPRPTNAVFHVDIVQTLSRA